MGLLNDMAIVKLYFLCLCNVLFTDTFQNIYKFRISNIIMDKVFFIKYPCNFNKIYFINIFIHLLESPMKASPKDSRTGRIL